MSDFAEYLQEVLRDFGPVATRRMFGGHGLYHDGLMIGLITGDTLFLKVDATSRAQFEARGLAPFDYVRQGKTVRLSFHQAPADMLESPAEAAHWARLAYAAALRSRGQQPPTRPKPPRDRALRKR